MNVVITVEELIDKGVWEDFCNLKDINVWAVAEGLMSLDEEFGLDIYEAIRLGLLPLDSK